MEEVRSEEKVVQRKKSFVVSTVEEHEASLDESKEWITNYLEGNQAQPDQFQKKYFDASSPSKTENVSQEELTKEIKAASEPSAAKIIETYEVVDNGPLPENIAAEISLGREASTKLKLEAKEEEDVDYTPKNISLPMDDLKKHEISNIAIQMTEKTNSGQLLSPSIEATSLPLSPIKEDASQNSNFKDYKTFAITGVSSAKLPTKQPIPDRKFSERPPSRKPSNNDLPFRMMNLKVKIYDLTPIRENHILKSDDEVRAHFIKTIETQRALIMKGSGEAKNPPKPQKSSQQHNLQSSSSIGTTRCSQPPSSLL